MDANSSGEVGWRQEFAELIAIEKNRYLLMIGPKGAVGAVPSGFLHLAGTISGTEMGTIGSA